MRIAVAGATGTVGTYLVGLAEAAGHDVVALSRSGGVDVRTGDGLDAALEGVDVVVDVTNAGTTDQEEATAFFTEVVGTLQRAAATAGVQHVVTLSIVGIDRVPVGYYGAKLAHEEAAAAGSVPSTILRATQFHEFPEQVLGWSGGAEVAEVPAMKVRTVAAASVAAALLDVAVGPPQGRARDVGGPEVADLVDLARAVAAHRGLDVEVRADAASTTGMPDDALLTGPEATIAGPTFQDWLDGTDAGSR